MKIVECLEGKTYEKQLRSLVQPKEEESECRLHGGLQPPHKRNGVTGAAFCSLVTATGPEGTTESCEGKDQAGYQEKILHQEGVWKVEQAPQGGGHGPKL